MNRQAVLIVAAAGALALAGIAAASETVTYTYDAKGRLVKVEHAGTVNNNVVANYSYDHADNRTNGKGKWVFSSQLQGATVVQAKVGQSKASGATCRPAFSPAKGL